jgi:polyhydroxybutyrate depolymerase
MALPRRRAALVASLTALTSLGLLSLSILGCSSEGPASSAAGTSSSGGSGGGGDATLFGGDRPVELFVPSTYDAAKPMPLVLMLHGYGVSGQVEEWIFKLKPEAEARGFLYAHPNGTGDADLHNFWNATDACCNFKGSDVDDSAYLKSLIDEIKGRYNVDPKRVFITGHSNGAFMSHRMACDHAGTIAAVAAFAGVVWKDTSKCAPSEPVHVLQVHGTADTTIAYEGGEQLGAGGVEFAGSYPGAETTVAAWAALNGCSKTIETGAPKDLETALAGSETEVSRYTACAAGGSAELWKMVGATHVPNFGPEWAPSIIDFFFSHPKP